MAIDMNAVKDSYATYDVMPHLSYNIIEHLMSNPDAEIIWKLLKYNSPDAWEKPNLSRREKSALIYDGSESQDGFSVFFDNFMDESTNAEKTFLRIYPSAIYPNNRTVGVCCVNIEVFTHSQINHLSDYSTRVDTIIQALFKVLNGVNVEGVGVLYFDIMGNRYCKMSTTGEKPYKGKIIVMGVNLS